MAQSKPKREALPLKWGDDSLHIYTAGNDWTVIRYLTLSTSEDGKYNGPLAHGSGLESLLACLTTLFPTSLDTPERPTCLSKVSPSGRRPTL